MIHVEALLAPVPGDAAEGASLRDGGDNAAEFMLLGDTGRQARRMQMELGSWVNEQRRPEIFFGTERQIGEAPEPNWADVVRRAGDLLTNRSKNLEVAAWLLEALIETDGLAGLGQGAAVLAGLIERYGPVLYPRLDTADLAALGDDAERIATAERDARFAPLARLATENGSLLTCLRRAVLFRVGDGTAFTLLGCQQSRGWSAMKPDDRERRIDALKKQAAGINRDASEDQIHEMLSPREKWPDMRHWPDVVADVRAMAEADIAQLREDATQALANWQAVTAALDKEAGPGRIVTAPLTALLTQIDQIAAELTPPAKEAPASQDPSPSDTGDGMSTGNGGALRIPGGPFTDREDALRALSRVAEYFRRAEPVSPLSDTLDELVRRARLSWHELLAEMAPDPIVRENILLRLGQRPENPEGNG